jgi:hypothetical protein
LRRWRSIRIVMSCILNTLSGMTRTYGSHWPISGTRSSFRCHQRSAAVLGPSASPLHPTIGLLPSLPSQPSLPWGRSVGDEGVTRAPVARSPPSSGGSARAPASCRGGSARIALATAIRQGRRLAPKPLEGAAASPSELPGRVCADATASFHRIGAQIRDNARSPPRISANSAVKPQAPFAPNKLFRSLKPAIAGQSQAAQLVTGPLVTSLTHGTDERTKRQRHT